jgi:PAS domain S-box-containing protein
VTASGGAGGAPSDLGPVEARLTLQQLRDLTESLPHLVWTCFAEGPCDYLSRQWCEYTGLPEQEQLGYGWLSQLHADDRERVKAEWAATVGRGVAFDIEFRIRRADGAHRWFRTRAIPLRDASGAIVKWYGSNTDIDDYKRTLRSLGLNEARLRLAQQVAGVGTFEWNLKTDVTVWTPELEAMHGLPPGGFGSNQQSWEALIHPEDRQDALARVAEALETGRTLEGEWRVVWPDGSVHWLVGRFCRVCDAAGVPERLVGVNIDITRRKAVEEDIRRFNEDLDRRVTERTAQLREANREMEAFSYSVAHDLRAPLRAMNGFAQVLAEDYGERLDETGRAYLARIERNASNMGDMIDALLSLSRISRAEIQPAPCDVSHLAATLAKAHLAADPARKLDLVVQRGIVAHLDPVLARVLLDNLLGNACKFTSRSAAPRIEVGAVASAEGSGFFVRDNGVGFEMAYAENLFKPFQRLHTEKEFPGHGIGLATSHRIVTRHGGHITATATLGGGATFSVTLPRPV